jgi:hypothetical protein
MAGVYRLKQCPQCNKDHRKRGPYCSQSCSNSHREVSDKVRENMRKVANEHNATPEGRATSILASNGLSAEDYTIEIPEFPDLPEGYDIADKW